MKMPRRKEATYIETFSEDVAREGGYLYSTPDRLSCRLANERITRAILELAGDLRPERVLDVGCGDGTYTSELVHELSAPVVFGIDPSKPAVTRPASIIPISAISGSRLARPTSCLTGTGLLIWQ